MSDELFNVFSAIGIGLTFFASCAAVIVSIVSLNFSNKAAKRSGYLSTITASRDKWSISLRECSSLYFTQIARLCSSNEDDLQEIYNKLTQYHFAIILLLFEQDKEIHDNMSVIRSKAFEIVNLNNFLKQHYKQESVDTVQRKINELKDDIINEYQGNVFNGIRFLLESEWRKQQYEATDMWKEKYIFKKPLKHNVATKTPKNLYNQKKGE